MIINTIQGGKAPVVQSKSVKSTTSQQTITAPSGVDGYNPITVEPIKLQIKGAVPNTDSPYYKDVFPDSGYDGLSKVQVAPVPLQEKTVSPSQSVQTVTPDTSGTYPSGGYLGLSKVTVNAAPLQQKYGTLSTAGPQKIRPDAGYYGLEFVNIPQLVLQNKTVTPSDSQQIITADSSFDGLNHVTVEAAPASGTKTAFCQLYPSTSTRIRINHIDTQGVTSPRFAVVQLSAAYSQNTNILYEGIYDSAYNFASRCFYSDGSNNILIQTLGLEVSLDANDILIEIKSSSFIFDTTVKYNIFISE